MWASVFELLSEVTDHLHHVNLIAISSRNQLTLISTCDSRCWCVNPHESVKFIVIVEQLAFSPFRLTLKQHMVDDQGRFPNKYHTIALRLLAEHRDSHAQYLETGFIVYAQTRCACHSATICFRMEFETSRGGPSHVDDAYADICRHTVIRFSCSLLICDMHILVCFGSCAIFREYTSTM